MSTVRWEAGFVGWGGVPLRWEGGQHLANRRNLPSGPSIVQLQTHSEGRLPMNCQHDLQIPPSPATLLTRRLCPSLLPPGSAFLRSVAGSLSLRRLPFCKEDAFSGLSTKSASRTCATARHGRGWMKPSATSVGNVAVKEKESWGDGLEETEDGRGRGAGHFISAILP